ncbi:hypothetical protein [uncultured Shewanella sp.]|uniref:hypothetical protein n=1 Tax=uncultured Shewanella sp. TaxID=173975 RepID=UPI0026036262|nr:hypothetical protein [uncultured Shewanella sp.]
MIEKLEHDKQTVAKSIHRVFQLAYQVEAQLLGVANFRECNKNAAVKAAFFMDEHVRKVIFITWDGVFDEYFS